MSIILSWNKKDSDEVLNSYEIYRSNEKSSLYQENNRIAEISDKSQVQFSDNDTQYDTPYWYGVRSKTIYGDMDSTPLLLVEVTNPGYGPALPLIGDFEDGLVATYPDEIPFTVAASKILNDEMSKYYTAGQINNLVTPVSSGGTVPISNSGYAVNKFWRNGKVIFVPNHPIGGITLNPLPVTDFYNKIIAPLAAEKRRVEIEGVEYEFGIMSREEVIKCIVSGSTVMTVVANSPNNIYSDRVTPLTYYKLSSPSNAVARVFHLDSGDGAVALNVSSSGAASDIMLGTNNTAGITTGIAWYFTPVKN